VELGTSAVIDILELDRKTARAPYVRDFLSSLISIPKSLYRPLLVIIDEAHGLCPENAESVATEAVIRLMDLGRKRGFCGILATQRLSKLDKDAAAECGNILIGRTSAIDIKRAAELLGVPQSERNAFTRLRDGEWLGFGPAMEGAKRDDGVFHFQAASVQTTHPKAGKHHKLAPPAAPAAIKRILPELADLARRDDADPLTLDEAKQQTTTLRKRIKELERQASKPAEAAGAPAHAAERQALRKHAAELHNQLITRERQWQRAAKALGERLQQINKLAAGNGIVLPDLLDQSKSRTATAASAPVAGEGKTSDRLTSTAERSPGAPGAPRDRSPRQPSSGSEPSSLPIGERRVLSALIQYPDGLRREQLTVLTAYKRSSRDTYLQRLRERGFIAGDGERVRATDEGIAALPDAEPLPTGKDLQDHWLARLPEGEKRILRTLIEAYPESIDRDALSESTGYKRSSRDTYLQRLRAKELILETGRGEVSATPRLFEE